MIECCCGPWLDRSSDLLHASSLQCWWLHKGAVPCYLTTSAILFRASLPCSPQASKEVFSVKGSPSSDARNIKSGFGISMASQYRVWSNIKFQLLFAERSRNYYLRGEQRVIDMGIRKQGLRNMGRKNSCLWADFHHSIISSNSLPLFLCSFIPSFLPLSLHSSF